MAVAQMHHYSGEAGGGPETMQSASQAVKRAHAVCMEVAHAAGSSFQCTPQINSLLNHLSSQAGTGQAAENGNKNTTKEGKEAQPHKQMVPPTASTQGQAVQ
jgi:hypothetical protein